MKLILASTSVYRRQLLSRLGLDFSCDQPAVDEAALEGETPISTAKRLALLKAEAVAPRHPGALIIGADQVAYAPTSESFEVFEKPGTAARAIAQLQHMRGKSIRFHTAVCVFNTTTGRHRLASIDTEARFRVLSNEEIERYVAREQPLDCAGAAKVEALGITLLEYVRDDDPTALIGLPLIALSNMLRAEGWVLP
jgi:septum formation protein